LIKKVSDGLGREAQIKFVTSLTKGILSSHADVALKLLIQTIQYHQSYFLSSPRLCYSIPRSFLYNSIYLL